MTVYRKMGLKMRRINGGWRVEGPNVQFDGVGNKGEVMQQYLKQNCEFTNGEWHVIQTT